MAFNISFTKKSGVRYDPVDSEAKTESETEDQDDSQDGSESHLIPKGHSVATQSKTFWAFLPWTLNVLLICTSVFLLYKVNVLERDSLEHGYSTDFGPVKHAIERQVVTFTGGPAYDENGIMFVPNPGDVDYIGDPSDEVDDAWENLITARYILMTEDEARQQWPDTYKEYYSPQRRGYVVGLDMFHTLHCLNNIRQSFYPEYYNISFEEHKLHTNHCIDQLRQYVMCAGDVTPIPTIYYPGKGRNYVFSDVPHTCRNFEKLREWQFDRSPGGRKEVLPNEEI